MPGPNEEWDWLLILRFRKGVREKHLDKVANGIHQVPFFELVKHVQDGNPLPLTEIKTVLMSEQVERKKLRPQFYEAVSAVDVHEVNRLLSHSFVGRSDGSTLGHSEYYDDDLCSEFIDAQKLIDSILDAPLDVRKQLASTWLVSEFCHTFKFWQTPLVNVAHIGTAIEMQNLLDIADMFDTKIDLGVIEQNYLEKPVDIAAEAGNFEVLNVLLDMGMPIRARTFGHCANCQDHNARDKIMAVLKDRSTDDVFTHDHGSNALIEMLWWPITSWHGCDEKTYNSFTYLLENGADPFFKVDGGGPNAFEVYFSKSIDSDSDLGISRLVRFLVGQRAAVRDGLINHMPAELITKVLKFSFPHFPGTEKEFLDGLWSTTDPYYSIGKVSEAMTSVSEILCADDSNFDLLTGVCSETPVDV